MANYVKYKLVGGPLKLKEDVVPHKFACQNQLVQTPERSVKAKAKLKTAKLKTKSVRSNASTSHGVEQLYIVDSDTVQVDKLKTNDIDPLEDKTEDTNIIKKKRKKKQVNIRNKVSRKSAKTDDNKHFGLPPKNKKTIEVKKQKSLQNEELSTGFEEKPLISKKSFSDYDIHTPVSGVTDSESEFEKDLFKNNMQKAALLCISREPQLLLGLPKKWYCCIQLLSESCKCSPRDVMVVLKKIRLYQSNAIIALDFGMTSSAVELIFRKKLPLISSCMKTLVFFPKAGQVSANIPMPFRKKYSNVKSIIDCLEIQIEKPTTAVKQALTWSEYKSCNTMKYLISITLDGLIHFVSKGYGGRASDSVIFEDCGILDLLPKNGVIMSDRGFENVSHLLQQKECFFTRLHSVSAKVTPNKREVLGTKKNAALRVHVERTIGGLRNFGFLMPHATVNLKHIDLFDYVMITACGLVNLQNSI